MRAKARGDRPDRGDRVDCVTGAIAVTGVVANAVWKTRRTEEEEKTMAVVLYPTQEVLPVLWSQRAVIDYKDTRFSAASRARKIVPSRISRFYKKQRELSRAIKRARTMAPLPYVIG